jgi:hypothetical protein
VVVAAGAIGLWIVALTKMSPAVAERAAPHFTPAVGAVLIVSMVVAGTPLA